MSSTVFTDKLTPIVSAWLNDINTACYAAIGSGGNVPTTPAQTLANIGGISTLQSQAGAFMRSPDTGAVNAVVLTLVPAPAALTPGMFVQATSVVASNTGAVTLNANGFGALPVVGLSNAPLQGGELTSGNPALFMLNSTGTSWFIASSVGALAVGTPTKPNQAAQFSQLPVHATTGLYGIVILGTASNINTGTAGVIPDAAAVNAASAGYGDYHNVTASRALNTVYTNTTGRPLFLNATLAGDTNPSNVSLTVGTEIITGSTAPASQAASVFGSVKPGGTYKVAPSGTSTLSKWEEQY